MAGFGSDDAREIVLRFVVGDGSPSRNERKHVFNPKLQMMGVAVGDHQSAFKKMALVTFAGNFYDNAP